MSRLRTFIAVDPGKAIRGRLITLQELLARSVEDVKWVEAENLHVTLLFLGEVDERKVVEVCRLVQEACQKQPPFFMSVEKVGCFPNERKPRVVWTGVGAGTQELCALHDALEGPLQELGYRREERRYTPHITLGRVKNDQPELSQALARRADWKAGDTEVREIHVMSSQLTPEGPLYSVLSRAKLG